MGIGPLADPSWVPGNPAIRLLLKPSFHPEACITIMQHNGAATLSVTVLAEMLWRQDFPCRLPSHHDDCELPAAEFTELAEFHRKAVTDREAHRMVCLDGIKVSCVWTTAEGHGQFESHVADKTLRTFVAKMIDQAWHRLTSPSVRNGLAECARYVGAEYAPDPVPTKPRLFRLGVFGTPDDIEEYFRVLKMAQRKA